MECDSTPMESGTTCDTAPTETYEAPAETLDPDPSPTENGLPAAHHVNLAFAEEDTVIPDPSYSSRKTSVEENEYNFSAPVVLVRDAEKSYNGGKKMVLNGFSMTVEKGTVYGLLGASGCGKTTALKCILGLSNVQAGDVFVFGKKPGSPGSGVPGNRVGYMPQDTALYGIFSIHETLKYYGTLYGMEPYDVEESVDFLIRFLRLPEKHKRVGTLSGGQQRRVSLAVALIHSPELLILDEPTVGVDPLLREKIWEYLGEIVSKKKSTVIITTHYIEEARNSHMIGMMRAGHLMAEDDPGSLLLRYNVNLLEDIVLKLCKKDERRESLWSAGSGAVLPKGRRDSMQMQSLEDLKYANYKDLGVMDDFSKLMKQEDEKPPLKRTFTRMRALTLKNVFTMWRNIALVLFMMLTPSIMILLICNGIGNDPYPLNLAIVNHESTFANCLNYSNWRDTEAGNEEECDLDFLSCKYLRQLPGERIIMKEYESEEEAIAGTKKGDVWGYLAIPKAFSDDLYARMATGARADEGALDGSFITFQLDMTSKQISGYIQKEMADAYEDFVKVMLKNCGLNSRLGDRPVKKLEPIYGNDDTAFLEFIAPSLLVGFMFFFPLCSSSIQYIIDKKLGTVERARAAGVHTSEIMVSYFLTEGAVMILQIILSMGIMSLMFGIKVQGSVILAASLYFFMGVGGVSAGFLLASICSQEVEAVLLAMASFFPNFLLSGLLWPVEGMPVWMQYATYILPATYPAESIRSIYSRAWGFSHVRVWPGYLATLIWLCTYWCLTILIHKVILRRK